MTINNEIMDLPEDSYRQYIDARQIFSAYKNALASSLSFKGGMIWREVNGKEYLIKTSPRGAQTGLGARSPESEAIYAKFTQGKSASDATLTSLKVAMERHRRMNRALRVGRTPNIIIDILSELDNAGMSEHFTVIGTNALYAYETAAGSRVQDGVLATRDVDLLWDNRKRLNLAFQNDMTAKGMIGFLKKIDPTFTVRRDQLYTAVNKDGYEVDILRRMGRGSESEAARLSQHDDDFWVVKARNADWLLSAPKFKEMVVGVNGSMAYMNTVDPRAFVLFKLWMAEQTDREYGKRKRDAAQAKVMVNIINERLPQFSFDEIKVFPLSVGELLNSQK
jgi:hypothetical protein